MQAAAILSAFAGANHLGSTVEGRFGIFIDDAYDSHLRKKEAKARNDSIEVTANDKADWVREAIKEGFDREFRGPLSLEGIKRKRQRHHTPFHPRKTTAEENIRAHFEEHKHEFSDIHTPEEYLQAATELVDNPKPGTIVGFIHNREFYLDPSNSHYSFVRDGQIRSLHIRKDLKSVFRQIQGGDVYVVE
ncbi:MAG: hypothetical protein KC476_03270 [Cyanobacteria bacterium HKST-UBA06]|nr:hypothetical protein [Cyanobacteria bacterium HKST-UBA06]